MKQPSPRIDVDLTELDQIIDEGMRAPLSASGGQKLKTTLHALVERVAAHWRTTEKTRAVLEKPPGAESGPEKPPPAGSKPASAGHGRNKAAQFPGAHKVVISHATLRHGDPCPECGAGKVYRQKQSKTLVRIVGRPPLEATRYAMERLRCNGCNQVFTAAAPPEAGSEKYDETAAAMRAQLGYGSGVPFKRLERLEGNLGIPLPAATQWGVVKKKAEWVRPALDELIRQAAQGEVAHNDDTGMRILHLAREPAPEGQGERTGVFTSGIVCRVGVWLIALFFSGWKHAGENLADVLKRRAPGLQPLIQMCDALSRNVPKLSEGVRLLLANCRAHGRRPFVEVAANFPAECRYVLETLGSVWYNDELARRRNLSRDERRRFHQEHSALLMKTLKEWMEAQLAEHKTEPNSGLGKAIQSMLRHWEPLTLFLREPGAPLDNNLVERALKKAILHRKNSLFYKTMKGAEVGDLFMSLIHTCELNGVNAFDYLTELQRHAGELKQRPSEWMPWNYRETLARLATSAAA
ncbi:MAG TPA: IS66 family transposase [Bryobacteraceae bacterium]|nr:IS66 family transposase [Bryobacteraceae bacterium]